MSFFYSGIHPKWALPSSCSRTWGPSGRGALWEGGCGQGSSIAGRPLSSGMWEADLGNPSRQPVTFGQAFDILLLAAPCNEGNRDNTDESLLFLIPSKLAVRVLVWVGTSNKGLHVCVYVCVCVRAWACVLGEEKEHLKAAFLNIPNMGVWR